MNEAKKGSNGHAAVSMQNVLLDAEAENQAAQVMNSIREHLPTLAGKSKEKVAQGVTNFLESKLKLTKVKVNVIEFHDQMRIAPYFSFNNSVTESPGVITMQKSEVPVSA